jgi:hypothetical protein
MNSPALVSLTPLRPLTELERAQGEIIRRLRGELERSQAALKQAQFAAELNADTIAQMQQAK